jgi:diketogulonate reductase-like aldo/keto reductase
VSAAPKKRRFGAAATLVPTVGQGTWNFPEREAARDGAIAALRAGVELGLTHIDTAEMYGNGRAEEIIGAAIRGFPRESLFIVSKVLPSNATYDGTLSACEASLRRLGTDYLDCYLLHWRGAHELAETMRAFERLVRDGKIRAFGVSNFDVDDLEQAQAYLSAGAIACNQVLYHLGERGVERRVLPYCRERDIAVVGYSPFGSGDFPSARGPGGRALAAVAQRHAVSPRAVALAFLTRVDGTFVIPKAARVAHVKENATAWDVELDEGDVAEISAAFPLPRRDGPLATL